MFDLSHKCAATVSLLALSTLSGDRRGFHLGPVIEEFRTTSGYVKRFVSGEPVHAVDWDGKLGVDSVLREGGIRSGALWTEYRGWVSEQTCLDLSAAGDKACQLLLKHFGPYHGETATAIQKQREIYRQRQAVEAKLDREFPPVLRRAVHDYLGPHLSLTVRLPAAPPAIGVSLNGMHESRAEEDPAPLEPEYVIGGPFSKAELVLRSLMFSRSSAETFGSVDQFARDVLERMKPLESDLEMLEMREALVRLPPIPGEQEPADLDKVHYGALICRHRAVVAGLLLADAGFDVEIVRGTIEQDGRSGGHLFVYAPERGILEPSADGPDFWREVVAVSQHESRPAFAVKGGAVYRFELRTPLRAR